MRVLVAHKIHVVASLLRVELDPPQHQRILWPGKGMRSSHRHKTLCLLLPERRRQEHRRSIALPWDEEILRKLVAEAATTPAHRHLSGQFVTVAYRPFREGLRHQRAVESRSATDGWVQWLGR
jgi:hypothetical protein